MAWSDAGHVLAVGGDPDEGTGALDRLLDEIDSGLRIRRVSTADEAREALGREDYDAVMVARGPLSSEDLLETVRSVCTAAGQRPVVLVDDGIASPERVEACVRAGVEHVLTQDGLSPDALAHVLRVAVARRRTRLDGDTPASHLRLALRTLPVVVWTTDPDLRFLFVHGAILEDLGVDGATLRGTTVQEFLRVDDPEAAPVRAHRMALDGIPSSYPLEWGGRSFRVFVEPRRADDGKIDGTVALALDVTDRRTAEEQLALRDAVLEAVSVAARRFLSVEEDVDEALPVVLERLGRAAGASRVYLFRNEVGEAGELRTSMTDEWTAAGIDSQAGEEMHGLSYEDLGFERWRDVLRRGEVLRGRVEEFPEDEAAFLRSQEIRSLVVVPVFAGDEWWGFLGFDECVRDRIWTPEVVDALRIAADILGEAVHRGRVEEALAHRETELHQAQKIEAVASLAGGIAHDFNNAITAIQAHVSLLLEDLPAGSPHRDDVAEIRRSSAHAAELTTHLLAFSRRQVLRPRVVDLGGFVEERRRMLRRVIREDVALVVEADDERCLVSADPVRLEQVLTNLVINARDAIDGRGTITVRTAGVELDEGYVARHAYVEPGQYALLSVADDGPGIPAETQERIFEPFFTTKPVGEGTGLGLSTVFGIVKQSGGYVWVYSEEGEGTVLKVFLPRIEGVEAPEPAAEERGQATGTERVLVVDDNEAVRKAVVRLLGRRGYEVIQASGPGRAVALIRDEGCRVDLLITDVIMPEMSGPELVREILDACPATRVLYTSGYAREALPETERLDPDVHFLEKPFDLESLGAAVRRALDAGE